MKEKIAVLKRFVDRLLDIYAIALFLGMFGVVLLQVFMRFCLDSPLVWSEELARYLFMWISLIGWVFATRSGTHIRVAIVADNLPAPAQKALDVLNLVLTVVFAAVLFWYGMAMLRKNLDVPAVTLFFTYAVVYAAVPFSTALIVFYSVVRFLSGIHEEGGTLA
ncbi:MAG: TRAP transporter small permease [Candidatus Accumulibacter sp.]|jgi:TRAP-type C4-dicarboxylate transport system permease small subunit|nr:TRAP transporter small permease [Accumulibacter sp.]